MIRNNLIFSRLIPLAMLLLAIVLSGGLSGCSSSNDRQLTPTAPETIRNVAVQSVQRADVPDLLESAGTVRAVETTQLASQMMGNIVELRVHEGDRVQRGQVLAVLERGRSSDLL
jgi:multidrug efflux pump subunit AcrA (membrane-fusion protein)